MKMIEKTNEMGCLLSSLKNIFFMLKGCPIISVSSGSQLKLIHPTRKQFLE